MHIAYHILLCEMTGEWYIHAFETSLYKLFFHVIHSFNLTFGLINDYTNGSVALFSHTIAESVMELIHIFYSVVSMLIATK